jgi:hypothetical protein
MADTALGPRPTITVRRAWVLVAGWILVGLLSLVTISSTVLVPTRSGWSEVMVMLAEDGSATCDEPSCTATVRVTLPDDRVVTADVTLHDVSIEFQELNKYATWHAWVRGDNLRASRPVHRWTRVTVWISAALAVLLTSALLLLARTSSKRHDTTRASNRLDLHARRFVPLVALLMLAVSLATTHAWLRPSWDPTSGRMWWCAAQQTQPIACLPHSGSSR